MRPGRARADEEPATDLFLAGTRRGELEHLQLPLGQVAQLLLGVDGIASLVHDVSEQRPQQFSWYHRSPAGDGEGGGSHLVQGGLVGQETPNTGVHGLEQLVVLTQNEGRGRSRDRRQFTSGNLALDMPDQNVSGKVALTRRFPQMQVCILEQGSQSQDEPPVP